MTDDVACHPVTGDAPTDVDLATLKRAIYAGSSALHPVATISALAGFKHNGSPRVLLRYIRTVETVYVLQQTRYLHSICRSYCEWRALVPFAIHDSRLDKSFTHLSFGDVALFLLGAPSERIHAPPVVIPSKTHPAALYIVPWWP